MKRIAIRPLALSIHLSFFLITLFLMANASWAGEDISVSIGSSTWSAKSAHSHDISRDALVDGQLEFKVFRSAHEAYPIQLSEKQRADILAGSTVVVETADGKQKVMIGPKEKKPARSGW